MSTAASVAVADHPLLDVSLIEARWPAPLGQIPIPRWLDALCTPEGAAAVPVPIPTDADRTAVRDLLRVGGFKPAGRSKPCNEYLLRAIAGGAFPRIDAVVDLTNALALHGGLPASTIDVDRARPPLHIAIAPPGTSMVFNGSGQVIDLGGLVCLFDADGPSADAVKDGLRTPRRAARSP